MPRFSILTPVFNGQAHIERMMQSIAAQTCKDFEHLILDGGSTDGTLAVAEKHKGANTKIISRKDKGALDAINRAWEEGAIAGDFLLLLCADDWFSAEAVEEMARLADENPQAQVLGYGLDFWKKTEAGLIYDGTIGDRESEGVFDIPNAVYGGCVNRAFHRDLLEKYGAFDHASWGCFADRELQLRFAVASPQKAQSRKALYNFRNHEASDTANGRPDTIAFGMGQSVGMARLYLDRTDLTSLQRRQLREWYAFCWVRAGFFLLRTGQIGKALALLLDGMIHRPTFCLQKILSPSMPEAYKIHHLSSSNGTEK